MATLTSTDPREVVMVVGAGSGIGQGVALHLSSMGRRIICVDRDLDAARSTADLAEGAVASYGDVTDESSIAAAFDDAVVAYGQVRAVVNSAGITGPLGTRSHEISLDEFDDVMRVNLRGALVVSRVVLPHMIDKGYGRVVHVASIAGKEGNPNMLPYSASKAGLIGLVKAQGKEYAKDGITINALAPAVISTPFIDAQPPDVTEYMREKIPMGRFGTVDEAAQMIAWMVSPECSFTTGAVFDLSGGRATY